MKKWLSFIVPIYNAEKYLRECVDSLLEQNFPKELYEIILYDDSSTDDSLNIAKEYSKKYVNVRVFTHPNVGVSQTRNAGLKEAIGEYIWFIDNDDYIAKNVLTVLYEWTYNEKVDLLIFDAIRFKADEYWKLSDFIIRETPVITGIEAFLNFYYDPVPWNKLFRRSFIEKYHLHFSQQLSEDSELCSRCFYHAEKIKAIPIDAVYYRVHDTSFSQDEANRKALVGGLLECLENHYIYMLSYPGDKFWMHAFVLDLRRLHNVGLERVNCTKIEKKVFVDKEKKIIRKIIHQLPVSLRLNYVILLICAISPTFILYVQSFLRRIKRIKSKMVKEI